MARPNPINAEIQFGAHELFFSKTDEKGIILAGNEVFVRVANYPKSKLIGKPHNIIRHPDMPKIVFKVLWDTIQGGNSISAYVKNLASDGRYYWVYANVFPVPGGYVSIRLKPTTAILDEVQKVYSKTLAKEKEAGMAASAETLMAELAARGFSDYPSFMIAALVAELKAREAVVSKQPTSFKSCCEPGEISDATCPSTPLKPEVCLHLLFEQCSRGTELFGKIFAGMDSLLNINTVLVSQAAFVERLATDISLLAINASLSSHQTDSHGSVMKTVAKALNDGCEDIRNRVRSVHALINDVKKQVLEAEASIGCCKLQLDMIIFFLTELSRKNENGWNSSSEEVEEMQDNCDMLFELITNSSAQVQPRLAKLKERLEALDSELMTLESEVQALEFVRKTGTIEAARLKEEGRSFELIFADILRLIQSAAKEMGTFRKSIHSVSDDTQDNYAAVGAANQTLKPLISYQGCFSRSLKATREARPEDQTPSPTEAPLAPA